MDSSPSADEDWVGVVRATLKTSARNVHEVKPWVYWRDMIVGVVIAYSAASVFLWAPAWSVWQVGSFLVAVFWLYRVGSLVHEVAHLGGREMTLFKVAWNLVVGIPTLTPSTFFTGHHRDHHTQKTYGTPQDPEYVVNVCDRGCWLQLLGYFLFVVAFPGLVLLRFLLAPLTFVSPRVREFTLRHLSAFTFNWRYERTIEPAQRTRFAALELACFVRALFIPGAVLVGVTEPSRIVQLYLLGASVVMLNQLRQLADHHFEGNGDRLSISDHVKDSCNFIARDPITWLLFPFSIQYHALHHLFPSMPYHNLAFAHQHLMSELPPGSPYRELTQPGWWSVASKMLRRKVAVAAAPLADD